MKVSLEPDGLKEKEIEVLPAKPSSSVFSNTMEKFTRKSSQTAPKPRCKRSSGGTRVTLDSTIHSDGWRGYNEFVGVGYGKHLRIDYGRDELQKDRYMLTVLKDSGDSTKLVCPSFEV